MSPCISLRHSHTPVSRFIYSLFTFPKCSSRAPEVVREVQGSAFFSSYFIIMIISPCSYRCGNLFRAIGAVDVSPILAGVNLCVG